MNAAQALEYTKQNRAEKGTKSETRRAEFIRFIRDKIMCAVHRGEGVIRITDANTLNHEDHYLFVVQKDELLMEHFAHDGYKVEWFEKDTHPRWHCSGYQFTWEEEEEEKEGKRV